MGGLLHRQERLGYVDASEGQTAVPVYQFQDIRSIVSRGEWTTSW